MTEYNNNSTGASSGGRGIIKYVVVGRVTDANILLAMPTGTIKTELNDEVRRVLEQHRQCICSYFDILMTF